MKAILNTSLLFAIFAVLGCASELEHPTRMIRIDSTPQGAQIIVNSFAMGKTPMSLEVEATDDGYFAKRMQITAVAQAPELFTQVLSYPPYSPSNPSLSEIPESINFDMTTSPAQKESQKEAQK